MSKYCETLDEAKSKKWKVVEAGSLQEDYGPEDDAIFTEDGKEILCTSEWLRVTDGVLDYIVNLHNASLR